MQDRVQDRYILKWHKAMAVAGRHFTKDEHAANWPASMKPDQLAALQQPYIMGVLKHRPGLKQYEETMKAITGACLAGALPHELTITHTPEKTIGSRVSFVKSWEGSQRRYDPPKTTPAKDVTVYRIAAPAFAAWLAAQGETPSPHIQAWFAAVGVAGTAQAAPVAMTDSAPPTPQAPARQNKRRDLLTPRIEAAQRGVIDPYDAPAIWAKLRTMADEKIKPLLGATPDGIQWIDGNDDVQFFSLRSLRDRLGRQKRATQKSVKTPLVRVK